MHTYHMLVKLCCSVSKAYNAMFVGDALILAHLIFTEDLMHHVVKQKTVIVCMAVECSNYPRIILQKKRFRWENHLNIHDGFSTLNCQLTPGYSSWSWRLSDYIVFAPSRLQFLVCSPVFISFPCTSTVNTQSSKGNMASLRYSLQTIQFLNSQFTRASCHYPLRFSEKAFRSAKSSGNSHRQKHPLSRPSNTPSPSFWWTSSCTAPNVIRPAQRFLKKTEVLREAAKLGRMDFF